MANKESIPSDKVFAIPSNLYINPPIILYPKAISATKKKTITIEGTSDEEIIEIFVNNTSFGTTTVNNGSFTKELTLADGKNIITGIAINPKGKTSNPSREVIVFYTLSYSHKGVDFWVAWPQTYYDSAALIIQTDIGARIRIEYQGRILCEQGVGPYSPFIFNLPSDLRITSDETVENRGIHITSTDEVSVIFHTPGNCQGVADDAYLAIPTNSLGKEYYVMTYEGICYWMDRFPSWYLIVACEDATIVTIGTKTFSMNKGETYQKKIFGDLTGVHIKSNKPIGVIAGSEMVMIYGKWGEIIIEMMLPLEIWGRDYYTPLLKPAGDLIRILSANDMTEIIIDDGISKENIILNKGEWIERDKNKGCHITSTKPIQVAQYTKGFQATRMGDPWQTVIIPNNLFRNDYRFYAVPDYDGGSYVTIISPDVDTNVILDDNLLVVGDWISLPGGGRYVHIRLSNGEHTIIADKPVGVYVESYSLRDDITGTYGYPAGFRLDTTISIKPDLIVEEILILPEKPKEGDKIIIQTKIHNLGYEEAREIWVRFIINEKIIGEIPIQSILGYKTVEILFKDIVVMDGTQTIAIIIDPENKISEQTKKNNIGSLTIFVQPLPPLPPKGLKAISSDSIIDLLWSANYEPDLAGYNIYRSQMSDMRSKINMELIITTSFRDTGLTNGIEYTYWVTAVDNSGLESNLSGSITAIPEPILNPPILIKPTVYGKILLTNIATTTTSGSSSSGFVEIFINGISFGTTTSYGSFTFTTILLEGTNTITAIAIKNGNQSIPSLPLIVILDTIPPQPPDGLIATPGNRTVWLNWNPISDIVGYNIYRDGIRINDELVLDIGYCDKGLINDKAYTYFITAVDMAGNKSFPSKGVKVTPQTGFKEMYRILHVDTSVSVEKEIEYYINTTNAGIYFKIESVDVSRFTLGTPGNLSVYDGIVFGLDSGETHYIIGRTSELKEYVKNGGGILWTYATLEAKGEIPSLEESAGIKQVGAPKIGGSIDSVTIIKDHEIIHFPIDVGTVGTSFSKSRGYGYEPYDSTYGGSVTTAEIIVQHSTTSGPNNFYLTVNEYEKGRVSLQTIGRNYRQYGYYEGPELEILANALYWVSCKPDLLVNKLYMEDKTIVAEIKNDGHRSCGSFSVGLFIDGILTSRGTLSLNSSSTATISFSIPLNSGFYTLRVIADPDNQVKEFDETNNSNSILIFITEDGVIIPLKPDLVPQDITIIPATPTIRFEKEGNTVFLKIDKSQDILGIDLTLKINQEEKAISLVFPKEELISLKINQEEETIIKIENCHIYNLLGEEIEANYENQIRIGPQIPFLTELLQSFPNPANNASYIPFKLSNDSNVELTIYNILGQKVRTIDGGQRKAGSYTQKDRAIFWDLRNDKGQNVSSGLYFYKINTGDFTAVKSMVVK